MIEKSRRLQINFREAGTAAIFIAFGIFFVVNSLTLKIGTAFRMGPGYFPLVLACILIALGVASGLRAFTTSSSGAVRIPWRGLFFILSAPLVFGLTVRGLGLLPSIALVVLISSLASSQISIRLALCLAAVLAVFCALVFGVGLGLPIPILGPWIGG